MKKKYEIEDDVVPCDEEGAHLTGDTKKLLEKLKKCQEEKQEYLDGWQRMKADLINSKKQLEEDKKSFVKYAEENLVVEILSVLDSFEMAFKDKNAWEKADVNWRQGVEYIYSQLKGVLESRGLKEISPVGEKFDPQQHHSVESVPTDDEKEGGEIAEVVLKGYKLNDKVVREASVKVKTFISNR